MATKTKLKGSAALATWVHGDFTIATGGELPAPTTAPGSTPHTFPWDALAERAADRPHFDVPDTYWTKREPSKPVPGKSSKWDRVRRSFEGWRDGKDLSPVTAAARKPLTILRRYNADSITVWVVNAEDALEAAKVTAAKA